MMSKSKDEDFGSSSIDFGRGSKLKTILNAQEALHTEADWPFEDLPIKKKEDEHDEWEVQKE